MFFQVLSYFQCILTMPVYPDSQGLYATIIGGCRAKTEPGHGVVSTNETLTLWLKFDFLSHILSQAAGSTQAEPWYALVCSHLWLR